MSRPWRATIVLFLTLTVFSGQVGMLAAACSCDHGPVTAAPEGCCGSGNSHAADAPAPPARDAAPAPVCLEACHVAVTATATSPAAVALDRDAQPLLITPLLPSLSPIAWTPDIRSAAIPPPSPATAPPLFLLHAVFRL